jgi:hypothetical protein
MIGAGHYNQRGKPVLFHPSPGFLCVAARIERGAAQINATGEKLRASRDKALQLACLGGGVNPGDEQPLRLAGGEELKGLTDTVLAAGQNPPANSVTAIASTYKAYRNKRTNAVITISCGSQLETPP